MPEPPIAWRLTPTEKHVLALMCRGLTNRQIAEALNVRAGTAKVHVSRVIKKLDAANRTQAATKALRLGLLSEEGDGRT